MRPNRSSGRNVHFYEAENPEEELGGLVLTNGITNNNFYSILDILLACDKPFSLRDENKILVGKDNYALQAGKYHITGESIFLFLCYR